MTPEIIYKDTSEFAEYEALNREYRADVTVKIGDKMYQVYITTMLRLQQDFETEIQDCGYYIPEPNIIIVKEVTKQEIESIVNKLYRCRYFERLDRNGFL